MPPFSVESQVRFSDLDGVGHVNNAIYHTYLEEARFALFRGLPHAVGDGVGDFLLARTEIDFLREVRLGDTVRVELWTEAVGKKSFTFGYELSVRDEPVARARSVLVWYDHATKRSVPVPDDARAFLDRFTRS